MTISGLFLKRFWFTCFIVTLLAGSLGLLAVAIDRFLLHEQLFSNGEVVVFVLIALLSWVIWHFIYPRYKHFTYEKKSADHNQSL